MSNDAMQNSSTVKKPSRSMSDKYQICFKVSFERPDSTIHFFASAPLIFPSCGFLPWKVAWNSACSSELICQQAGSDSVILFLSVAWGKICMSSGKSYAST
eukprot:Lithocolla_globosa_v1_NODE_4124_length_1505_cov_14.381379.p3 type:complete len:101 gc:universal NODE_4124_length_1505_cov_14.381379:1417-1115(-)